MNVNLIETFAEAEAFMHWLGERRPVLAMDTETEGLEWWHDKLRLVQFGDHDTGWAIPFHLWGGLALDAIGRYAGPVTFHNAKFDVRYLTINGANLHYDRVESLDTLLVGRRIGRMHIVCYLRQGSKVFETYWTTSRGVEVMDNNYHLLDLTVYGRQEKWEDSPAGWPQQCTITRSRTGPPTWEPEWPGGRPIAQWPRLETGYSDDLGTGRS